MILLSCFLLILAVIAEATENGGPSHYKFHQTEGLRNFKPDIQGYLGSVPTKAVVAIRNSAKKNFGNVTFMQDYFTPNSPVRVTVNIKGLRRKNSKYVMRIHEFGRSDFQLDCNNQNGGKVFHKLETFKTNKKGDYWNIFTTDEITLRGDLTSILGRALSITSNNDQHCDNIGLADEIVWHGGVEE